MCGDGRRYKLNLRTDNSFDGVNYQVQFHPSAGIWTTCRPASADFLPSWRGKPVPDAPALDTSRVRQIGLMIADRQEGPFVLAVRSIAAEISVISTSADRRTSTALFKSAKEAEGVLFDIANAHRLCHAILGPSGLQDNEGEG